jgi:hypothetical protein
VKAEAGERPGAAWRNPNVEILDKTEIREIKINRYSAPVFLPFILSFAASHKPQGKKIEGKKMNIPEFEISKSET